jgi:hypothetical protein
MKNGLMSRILTKQDKKRLFENTLLEFYLTKHSSLTEPSPTGLFAIRRPGQERYLVPEKTPKDMAKMIRKYPKLREYELVWIDSNSGEELPLPDGIQTPADLVRSLYY